MKPDGRGKTPVDSSDSGALHSDSGSSPKNGVLTTGICRDSGGTNVFCSIRIPPSGVGRKRGQIFCCRNIIPAAGSPVS